MVKQKDIFEVELSTYEQEHDTLRDKILEDVFEYDIKQAASISSLCP